MPFPSDPAGQTPANTFSPTSTPDANTLNNATYTYNATDNQWSTRDVVPPQPAPPPAGTQIATPSIVTPADGTSGIDPDANVTITSSDYDGTNAGTHNRTSWQVVEGVQPRVSTNNITTTTEQLLDYTSLSQFTSSGSAGKDARQVQDVWCTADHSGSGGAPARIWARLWNGAAGHKGGDYQVLFSEDNGVTWSDDTARAKAASSGTSWSAGGYEPVGNANHGVAGGYNTAYVGGTGKTGCDRWFFIIYGNCMNPSNNIYSAVSYDATTDSYVTWTNTGCGHTGAWYVGGIIGVLADGRVGTRTDNSGGNTNSFNICVFDLATQSSLPSTTGPSDLGTFCDNGTIYFGCHGKNVSNNFFTCPIGSDLLEPANWTVINTDSVMNSSRVRGMSWIPQMNEFCAWADNGQLFWFNPIGNTWRLQRLDYSDNLINYFWDGRVHTFNTMEGNMIFTPDFDFFDIRTTPGEFMNQDNDGSAITGKVDGSIWYGRMPGAAEDKYYGFEQENTDANNDQVDLVTTDVPRDSLVLTIAGAQTDGFVPGNMVENRGAPAASGTIMSLDDTSVTLVGTTGTWNTQRIAIPPSSFSSIIDDRGDTENLTSKTIDASMINPFSDYRVRCEYRSDLNVASDISAWSTFSTTN